MATEIEIVSTIPQKKISPKEILNELNIINKEVFNNIFSTDIIEGVKDQGGNIVNLMTEIPDSSYLYFYNKTEEKLIVINGPNHEVHDELFTAEEKINDTPRFNSDLLSELSESAATTNTSYLIRWSPTIDQSDLLAYALVLCICNLLNGVIINNFGSNIEYGTYLADGWKKIVCTIH